MKRWRLGHRPGLDGLRGLAIILVVICHGTDQWWPNAFGSTGVTMFFTLSGFLITTLLLQDTERRGRVGWRHFYERRARRLLPAAVVVVLIVGTFQVPAGLGEPLAIVSVLGYGANWAALAGVDLGILNHAWSLAVEEQFYLIWPVVVAIAFAFLGRRRSGFLLGVAAVGVAASIALRFALWDDGDGWHRVYFGSDTRADAIFIGCALAVLVTNGWRPRIPVAIAPLLLAGVVAVIVSAPSPHLSAVAVPTAVPWVTVVVILAALDGPAWLGGAGLRWWGHRSYGIYLWHHPLMYGTYFATGSFVATWVAAAVSLGIAELSWRFVERPALAPKGTVPA